MEKRFTSMLAIVVIVLVLSCAVQAEVFVFCDDFNEPLASSGWSGVIGTGSIQVINGELYMESSGAYWRPPFDPLGPFLYFEVPGDFVATVHITDYPGLFEPNHSGAVYNNNCGLMARVGELGSAGNGEDWISIDYFPLWDCDNFLRSCNNGDHSDICHNGRGWDADFYLQLSRTGNIFFAATSPDGYAWTEMICSPIARDDLEGLPLQVGLHHSTGTASTGYAAFDDFCVTYYVENPYARKPSPEDGAINVVIDADLYWEAGDLVQDINGHEVYIGRDRFSVIYATRAHHPFVNYYNVSTPFCDVGQFEFGTTYYWRVDEVNDSNLWSGDVWSFTTRNNRIVVEDFDSYSTRDELRAVWKDGFSFYPTTQSGSNITPSTVIDPRYPLSQEPPGPIYKGGNAMQFVYDNDGLICIYVPDYEPYYYYVEYYYSEIEASMEGLGTVSDWTTDGVKTLSLWFYGDPGNDVGATEQMYVALEDGNGIVGVAKYGDDVYEDMNDLKKDEWQEWNIAIEEFGDKGVDITDVNKVYIGFGDRDSHPNPGGYGVVYFDSIRLYVPRCLAEFAVGDLSGDCTIDSEDFVRLANDWHGGPSSADLNDDDEVDFGDLYIIVNKWLQDVP